MTACWFSLGPAAAAAAALCGHSSAAHMPPPGHTARVPVARRSGQQQEQQHTPLKTRGCSGQCSTGVDVGPIIPTPSYYHDVGGLRSLHGPIAFKSRVGAEAGFSRSTCVCIPHRSPKCRRRELRCGLVHDQ
uniref:Putative secreted protein n=1 Tax=Ixodes ricinus TaxID=34613 RepID=A0A6B0USK2_IXORI